MAKFFWISELLCSKPLKEIRPFFSPFLMQFMSKCIGTVIKSGFKKVEG